MTNMESYLPDVFTLEWDVFYSKVGDYGQSDLEVIFKLRKNKKTGQWKIYDMVAEGISLLSAKQSELSGLIRDKGIDAVSKQLNEHVAATASK